MHIFVCFLFSFFMIILIGDFVLMRSKGGVLMQYQKLLQFQSAGTDPTTLLRFS